MSFSVLLPSAGNAAHAMPVIAVGRHPYRPGIEERPGMADECGVESGPAMFVVGGVPSPLDWPCAQVLGWAGATDKLLLKYCQQLAGLGYPTVRGILPLGTLFSPVERGRRLFVEALLAAIEEQGLGARCARKGSSRARASRAAWGGLPRPPPDTCALNTQPQAARALRVQQWRRLCSGAAAAPGVVAGTVRQVPPPIGGSHL
jgi:hypothetical protein